MHWEIENPADYQAGLYIRLSKEDENEGPSESVSNQKSLLEEFVRQHRLQVFDTYIDDGWSGTNFDRPAFQRLIADIEAKKVNMVLTKDLSRLGRDYILTGHYMERFFPEHRVRYISLLDGIDTGVSTATRCTPPRKTRSSSTSRLPQWCAGSSAWPSPAGAAGRSPPSSTKSISPPPPRMRDSR